MDFEALFPSLVPQENEDLYSVDISVDDIALSPLEKAVESGIYRALQRWNEGDSALTDKTLPYAERVRKYQRIAALALQSDGMLTTTIEEDEDEGNMDRKSEEEQRTLVDRATVVAKKKAAIAAINQQKWKQKKMQKEREEERLRFEAVFDELENIDDLRAERAPSERLRTFVDSCKVKKRRLAQKRSAADTITAMSFDFARPMPDVNEHEQEETDKIKTKATTEKTTETMKTDKIEKQADDAATDNDLILWFDVLHPSKDPARTQSFLVRRSQRISELVDLIACASDERLSEHARVSKLVYFDRKFFVDRRVPGALDYSKQIVRWIQAKTERQTRFGTFLDGDHVASSLHSSAFADVKLHVDVPGVYIHQGECEHLLRLRDARLPHEFDSPKKDGIFPLRLPNSLNRMLRNCLICQNYSAKFVCYGDRLAVVDPMFFCDRCYHAAHYDADGNLIYNDFFSFPFVQD